MNAPPPRNIMITGASGAIGSALALFYSVPGVSLYLLGRQLSALEQVANQCRERGASVEVACVDLTNQNALLAWCALQPTRITPDLVIINAGLNHTVCEQNPEEDSRASSDVLTVNLMSAIKLVQSYVPFMRTQGHGQIALISSLAAWRGLPCTASYSASKAGIKAYGESLRAALAPSGICVNVVLAGYVSSPMCDAMPGPKPGLIKPKKAAKIIANGLAKNKGRISFPFWLSIGSQCLAVLPDAWAIQVLNRLGYGLQNKRSQFGRHE